MSDIDEPAIKELRDIRSNFHNRLKQARATHDDHMVAILGRRVSALDAGISALERQRAPEGFIKAVRRLAFNARTSGGVAGRDEELCNALDDVEIWLEDLGAAPEPDDD